MTKKQQQDLEAAFLEKLPIQVIAHLTFPKVVTEVERDSAFHLFIKRVQLQHHSTIGYIRGDEAQPHRHIHVALVSFESLSTLHVEGAWHAVMREVLKGCLGPGYTGGTNAVVEAYRRGNGGVSYAMKMEGVLHCNLQLSGNLDWFAPWNHGRRSRPSTSRERRHGRRIMAQRVRCRILPQPPTPVNQP